MLRAIVVFFCSLSAALAQQQPDAAAIMKKSADAVRRLRSLQYTLETSVETSGPMNPPKTVATMTLANPGKMRSESTTMGITVVMASNGETTWLYQSMSKEYIKVPAALGAAGIFSAMGMPNFVPDEKQLHAGNKLLREESTEIDGVKHDCWVVETRLAEIPMPALPGAKMSDMVMTTWVDKKLGLDLRADATLTMSMPALPAPMKMHMTMVKSNLKLDEPVPDSVFNFTPPPDAKLVEKMSFGGIQLANSELVGKPAPAFEVKTLDGKAYSAAALKGKVALLDFWATWCGPCRQSMPVLEKLSAEFKDRLVILGVNTGEETDTVAAFLKKTPFAYPAVLSGESGILSAYGIKAYPTFVLIGADGTVAGQEVGFGGENQIRALLEKAGIKPAK